MNIVEKFNCSTRLVALQMSNQVPARSRASELSDLGCCFLNSIFTEICYSQIQCGADDLCGMRLADGDQPDVLRRALRAPRGCTNSYTNVFESVAQSLQCFLFHDLNVIEIELEYFRTETHRTNNLSR